MPALSTAWNQKITKWNKRNTEQQNQIEYDIICVLRCLYVCSILYKCFMWNAVLHFVKLLQQFVEFAITLSHTVWSVISQRVWFPILGPVPTHIGQLHAHNARTVHEFIAHIATHNAGMHVLTFHGLFVCLLWPWVLLKWLDQSKPRFRILQENFKIYKI